ncbi:MULTISPECIES: cyclase family protein [Fictibacillus]|jgi:arylformamidase|uniref:cyclase family protein n=1 Tax=Fictibacillus TaxID=1329200 RepID=UPI0018CF772B|nr:MULTISPECIES: cyclase family protein [unclassified Fictibacillus]MBH0156050.1 cyclase family protein [Fictibacillus sp. 5RED26]MBH0160839.1 cyclase family protein [Fictibacillus sp. 26RED30]MBH0165731.1 cyclase family protein [Fictibacillus sp. 7GRE50]MBH0173220.1 cyclase family protein [Fictibacillus sp. 23RED33]
MKIFDVSLPIFEGMPVYKNKPEKQPEFNTAQNGHVTETRISMDVHTGTHVDAPLHMVPGGDTIETLPIEKLVRKAKVIDLTSSTGFISAEDLADKDIQKDDFVLFKTKNSWDTEFNFEFIYVNSDAAKVLAEIGVAGVGIDALGVERAQENHPTHKQLFQNNIIIIEGLQLKDVPEGEYLMVAAPLKIRGLDASPARIVLIEQ